MNRNADNVPEGAIRLRSGIDINQLQTREGVIFETEIDESFFENNNDDTTYFANVDESEFEDLMNKVAEDKVVDDEEDYDDNLGEYENKMRKMKPIQIQVEEENGEKRMVTVPGVMKKVIKQGLMSQGPVEAKSTVTIHYSLFLEGQDESFDSSRLRNRAEKYPLDDGRLLPGIEFAVKSMLVREKSEFIILPECGYGKFGCPPRVPGDAQILAVIELMAVDHEADAAALMSLPPEERNKKKTFEDIYNAAKMESVEGTEFVEQKDFMMAAKRYAQGVRLMEDVELRNDQEEEKQKALLLKLYLNLGYACLKTRRPKKVCTAMRKALEIDNRNPKALYRMGLAKRLLGHYDEALNYLNRALKILPCDPDIGGEKLSLEKQLAREKRDELELCKRMFNSGISQEEDQTASADMDDIDDIDDDLIADIFEQLEAFKASNETEPLKLPSDFGPSEIAFAKQVANDVGLTMKERKRGDFSQWMIFKE